MSASVDRLAVVVPARNEAEALPACLVALGAARAEAMMRHVGLVVDVIVVLDRCTDASERIARASGVEVVISDAGSVGAARALGFAHALEQAGDLSRVWLASSDADSVVPAHWLTTQMAVAGGGGDVVIGTVEPDAHLPAAERDAWFARHELGEDHPHVHGANLGMRASAYVAVGGFADLSAHEDIDLVQRLRAHPQLEVRATDAHRVVTSSRMAARAEGGFADYLKSLRGVMGG